jgi:hypothetical protein
MKQQARPGKNAATFRKDAGLFIVKSILIVLLACAAAIVPLIAAPQEDSRQAADQD